MTETQKCRMKIVSETNITETSEVISMYAVECNLHGRVSGWLNDIEVAEFIREIHTKKQKNL